MMKEEKHKLTLDQPETCQIKVPGMLDESRFDLGGDMSIAIEEEEDGPPVSILTVTSDQAALQSLLHRLYSLGLPLISVLCEACKQQEYRSFEKELSI
jgi:hypothetical protein